jgi:hypothetical protein
MTSLQGHYVFPPLIALAILGVSDMAEGQQPQMQANGRRDYIVSVGRSNGTSRASAGSREQARSRRLHIRSYEQVSRPCGPTWRMTDG